MPHDNRAGDTLPTGRFLLLILSALSLAGCATGQALAGKQADADQQAAKEVLALEDEQVQYVQKGDTEALSRVYADGIAYTYSNGELVSKTEALARIRSGKKQALRP